MIVLIPTLAAACIAVSRIMDARHHPFDILFGSALGILVAWGSYRQYFPAISHPWEKGRAYPMRTWGVEMKLRPSGHRPSGSGRVDRTASVVTADHDDDPGNSSYGMEPIRAPTEYRGASPSRQPQGAPSTGPIPPRPTSMTSQPPSYGHQPVASADLGASNVFRDQISRSRRMRTGGNGGNGGNGGGSDHSPEGHEPISDDEFDEIEVGEARYRRPLQQATRV